MIKLAQEGKKCASLLPVRYRDLWRPGVQVTYTWGKGYKSFCCTQPPPYTGCSWLVFSIDVLSSAKHVARNSHGNSLGFPFFCNGNCAAGKTPIATDTFLCITGASFFCCDSPGTSVRIPCQCCAEQGANNRLQNNPALIGFSNLVSLWKNNPTCVGVPRAVTKRQSNNGKLTLAQELTFLGILTTIFKSQNGLQGPTPLQTAQLAEYHQNMNPILGVDPLVRSLSEA